MRSWVRVSNRGRSAGAAFVAILALSTWTATAAAASRKAPPAAAPETGWGLCRKPAAPEAGPSFAEVPGGDMFGFTSPTDVGSPGDCGVALEYSGRSGKGDGRYGTGTLKVQFGATVAENLAIAVSPFVSHYHIRSVTGLDDFSSAKFDGVSGELSYRFLERTAHRPFAVTVSVEPRWARMDADGPTGMAVTAYLLEFKLFADAVLWPGRLFGAINFNYAPATQKFDADPLGTWAKFSSTNISGALTYQVTEHLMIGTEVRYLAAFEGYAMKRKVGNALFAGPTIMFKISDNLTLNAVWTPQVWGHADGVDRRRDLDNFEKQEFRIKLTASH